MGLYLIHKVRSCIFHVPRFSFISTEFFSAILSPISSYHQVFLQPLTTGPCFTTKIIQCLQLKVLLQKIKRKLLLITHLELPSAQRTQVSFRRGLGPNLHVLLGGTQISLVEHLPPPASSPGVRADPRGSDSLSKHGPALSPALCLNLGPQTPQGAAAQTTVPGKLLINPGAEQREVWGAGSQGRARGNSAWCFSLHRGCWVTTIPT